MSKSTAATVSLLAIACVFVFSQWISARLAANTIVSAVFMVLVLVATIAGMRSRQSWRLTPRKRRMLRYAAPALLVLLVFLVPFLIVEPLLVGATIAIAMGYVLSGAIAWIVLKFLAVALIPAIFDLTKHKLMTMPWFVRAYEKVMAFHHYADQIVAPYKNAAATVLRQWRMRAATVTRRVPGLAHLAARFAARKRANGRPAMPSGG